MQETERITHITSTPLELSQQSNESGYHSNTSCSFSSSYSSSGILHLTKLQTPDNFSSTDPIAELRDKNEQEKVLTNKNQILFKTRNLNLAGCEHVDFLYYLGSKCDYFLITKKILCHLDDEDLLSAAAVSKVWKNVITSVPAEKKRLRNYVREIKMMKENRKTRSSDCDGNEDKSLETPRTTLVQIQNICKDFTFSNSPVSSSPIEKLSNYRFEAYQKEGRKLKLGKRLYSCPKCKLPAHIDQKKQNTAQCTNSACRYRFCYLCQCEEHISKICDFISTPVIRKQTASVGTLTSKKNLKRLLL